MKFYNFEYDGINLNSFGFIVCKFGSDGVETVSNGSNITFNTVSTMNGTKHELTSTEYGDCLSATFQICKNPCVASNKEISIKESREIMKWLNRKGFHKFKLFGEEYTNIFFEASFNVSTIELNGKIYGFELEVITNRPFALQEPVTIIIENTELNGKKTIVDLSDEEGYIYPEMEITINHNEKAAFEMYNALEKRTMRIANCEPNEVIKVKYPIIESTLSSHKIQNDFNWKFFRIANTFRNKKNDITISLPCTIKLKYSPIIKIGI